MADLAHVTTFDSTSVAGSGITCSTSAFALTAGNHVFAYVRWESSDTTTVCTDTAGNTYTALTSVFNSNVGGRWFYCLNAAGHATNVVTVTFGASRSFEFVQGFVFSGDIPSAVSQVSGTASATSVTTSSGLTVSNKGVLLAGASTFNNSVSEAISDSGSHTWTTNTVAAFARTAYTILAALVSGVTVTATGTNTTRLVAALGVEPGAPPPPPPPPPAPSPSPSTPLPSIIAPPPVPVFFVGGHGIDEDSVYAQVKFATGHHRARRLWTVTERAVTVEWQLEPDELATVEDWFENTLEAGTLPFTARVRSQVSGQALVYWRARWIDFQTDMMHLGRGHVRGTLLLTGDPSDNAPTEIVGRVTEDDDLRATEDGDIRIIE